jgi:proteasome accessory factor C
VSARPQPDVMRMLTLVPWLIERPGASLEGTAAAFATDVATVRAELEHLDYCGLPGLGGGALFDVTIIGDHVTVRMADELRYPMRPTPHEALRLLLIATAADRIVGVEVPALRSAIGKLHHALGVAEGSVVVLDEPDDAVQAARAAIAARVRVRFDYRGRADREPAARTVEPWAVELSEGAWYLHGLDADAGAARVFRLDRASGLHATEEHVTSEAPSDLERPVYVPGDEDLEVELLLAPTALWLLDAVTADSTEDVAEGRTLVRLRTGSPEWFTRLVLMAGGAAEVVQPVELRERVRSRAQEALARLA